MSNNLNLIFIDKEDDAKEIDQEFIDCFLKGEEGEFTKNHPEINKTFPEVFFIEKLINFTFDTEKNKVEKKKIKHILKNNKVNFKLKKNECNFSYCDFSLHVLKLTNVFPQIKESVPIIKSYRKRRCNCHDNSIQLSVVLQGDCEVVTGNVYTITDKTKYLHTWLELELDGKDVVIDGNFNAVFNKEEYYKFRNVEPLTRDKWDDTISGLMFLNQFGFGNDIDIKEYLYFKDEIRNDLLKNKEVFNLHETN